MRMVQTSQPEKPRELDRFAAFGANTTYLTLQRQLCWVPSEPVRQGTKALYGCLATSSVLAG